MVSQFSHARRRLARAKLHTEEFIRTFQSFLTDNPPRILEESNPQRTRRIIKIALNPLPEVAEDLAVDAISGLRAALDYAAYASVIALGDAKSKQTHFPFGDDERNLQSMRHRSSRALHPEVFDLFASFEPYPRGKGALLWSLNQLRNIAEHKAVVAARIHTGQAVVNVPFGINPATVRVLDFPWDGEKHEVALFEVGPERFDASYNFQLSIKVTFPEGPGIGDQSAGDFLESLVGVIDSIVSATESETARLSRGTKP